MTYSEKCRILARVMAADHGVEKTPDEWAKITAVVLGRARFLLMVARVPGASGWTDAEVWRALARALQEGGTGE